MCLLNIMFQFFDVQVFVLVMFVSGTFCEAKRYRNTSNPCRIMGSHCIILTACRPFMDFITALDKPLRPSVVVFLRSQQCGFRNGYPEVCCTTVPKGLQALTKDRATGMYKNATTMEKVPKVDSTQEDYGGKKFGEDVKDAVELSSNSNMEKSKSDIKDVKALPTINNKTQLVTDKVKKNKKNISQKGVMEYMDDVEIFNFLFRTKRANLSEDDRIEIR